jgi:DNA-binding GntR family transcriptional regulator
MKTDTAVVVETLRKRIADDVLLPGVKLVEVDLAEEFGVTRLKVREALASLEQYGLVERIPNKGAIVSRVSFDQILKIYEAREALEGISCRLAAERAPDHAWDELIALFGTPMEQYLERQEFDSFLDGYELFRAEIQRHAGNPLIQKMLDSILERTRSVIRRAIVLPGRAQSGLQFHRRALAALKDRDGILAEQIRRTSLQEAVNHLLKYRKYII